MSSKRRRKKKARRGNARQPRPPSAVLSAAPRVPHRHAGKPARRSPPPASCGPVSSRRPVSLGGREHSNLRPPSRPYRPGRGRPGGTPADLTGRARRRRHERPRRLRAPRPTHTGPGSDSGTQGVLLTVSGSGDTWIRGVMLHCEPTPHGHHPRAAETCAALDAAHGDLDALPAGNGRCTMQYDPVTVAARGSHRGGRP